MKYLFSYNDTFKKLNNKKKLDDFFPHLCGYDENTHTHLHTKTTLIYIQVDSFLTFEVSFKKLAFACFSFVNFKMHNYRRNVI